MTGAWGTTHTRSNGSPIPPRAAMIPELSGLCGVVVDRRGATGGRRFKGTDVVVRQQPVGQEPVCRGVGASEEVLERLPRREVLALLHRRIAAVSASRRMAAPEAQMP